MNEDAELQTRMAELKRRYLARTVAEMNDLQQLVDASQEDGEERGKKIEILAHRVRGSGAMFGFNLISDAAFAVEMLALETKSAELDPAAWHARLSAAARVLAFVVRVTEQESAHASDSRS